MTAEEVVLGILQRHPPLPWKSLKNLAHVEAGLSSRQTNNVLAALIAKGAVAKTEMTVLLYSPAEK